jgi:DNA-binding NtrC family response regulator
MPHRPARGQEVLGYHHRMDRDSARVLVADDQPDVLEALRLLLKGEQFQVETAGSPAGVLHAVDEREFDVVLMDLNYARDTTSGREGLDLLSALRAADPLLPIVVMTAWGSVEGAVEAMRRGARDYIEKPWDNARLVATLRTQVELSRALRRTERLEGENRLLRRDGLPEMIAESRAMQPVLHLLKRIGPSSANVLITGDHGTGKEVVARWLHGLSPRADRPLVTVNAGGLAEGVFESELFGHVKGAFTDARSDRVGYFEMADGGTLFLDEVGNIPASQQAKLLRVLQTGELQRVGSSRARQVDVRVLAATNIDINREVGEGRFREDLLYRLNTVEIRLPPLRDRTEDLPRLAIHFLSAAAARYGRKLSGFTPGAMEALMQHPWPGNVRELEHAVERAVLLAGSDRAIGVEDLLLRPVPDQATRIEDMTLDEVERHLIRRALEKHEGNVSRAADALGLSRSALYRRLQQHDLAP